MNPPTDPAISGKLDGAFVYVITGQHGKSKIGVSGNPIARLAQLQTGSPDALALAFIGATNGGGYRVEAEAKRILAKQSLATDEWFDVQPELAISVVMGAAVKVKEPVAVVSASQVPTIIRACLSAPGTAAAKPSAVPYIAATALMMASLAFIIGKLTGGNFLPPAIGVSIGYAIALAVYFKVR